MNDVIYMVAQNCSKLIVNGVLISHAIMVYGISDNMSIETKDRFRVFIRILIDKLPESNLFSVVNNLEEYGEIDNALNYNQYVFYKFHSKTLLGLSEEDFEKELIKMEFKEKINK